MKGGVGKMESLVLPKKEALAEKVREDFVGVVVHFEYPCNCPICQKGAQQLGRSDLVKAHIIVKPIEVYGNLMHSWYAGKTVWSSMGGFVIALDEILGFEPSTNDPKEAWKEVKEYLLGNRAFKFTSEQPVKFVEMTTSKEAPHGLPEGALKAKEQWFPIREYSAEEVKKYYGVDIEEIREIGKRELEETFKQIEREMEFIEGQW